MTTNIVDGEKHTPAKDLATVGLLIYRINRKETELFVCYNESKTPPEYYIPDRVPRPGEIAIDTAKRIGHESLDYEIPEDNLSYQRSAIVEGSGVKVRVFMVKSTSELEKMFKLDKWRNYFSSKAVEYSDLGGWKFTFILLSSFEGRVWLHRHIGSTASSLKMLVKED
ncbi:hypothetical protein F4859DRAFT_275763 [Xylaria cf. heliscus]|nr:hypothetical protein F4859DRAFT_275763 [Xylaria cf. heliscus]